MLEQMKNTDTYNLKNKQVCALIKTYSLFLNFTRQFSLDLGTIQKNHGCKDVTAYSTQILQ